MTFNGKVDQIAYISRSTDETEEIKRALGFGPDAAWIEDFVVADGEVFGHRGTNTARLLFNYERGIEIEILQYTEGPNYADGVDETGGGFYGYIPSGHVCHIGIHAEAGKEVPVFDYPIAQRVETRSHTNPYLLEQKRTYRYTIYDTVAALGHYTKVIERIQHDG